MIIERELEVLFLIALIPCAALLSFIDSLMTDNLVAPFSKTVVCLVISVVLMFLVVSLSDSTHIELYGWWVDTVTRFRLVVFILLFFCAPLAEN